MAMTVYGLLMFFGFTLLSIGAYSVLVSAVRKNFDGGDGEARAEASISSRAIKIMGQPALVFGICCLVMAFAVDYVAKSKPQIESGRDAAVPLGSVDDYGKGGNGALLVTIPAQQAVQLFGGEIVMRDWGGPKVNGALLSETIDGPYEREEIRRNPGEQCFLRRTDGQVFRVNLLRRVSTGEATYSIHPVAVVRQ